MNDGVVRSARAKGQTLRSVASWVVAILMILALSLVLLIRESPALDDLHVDGTVFAYGGSRILKGDLPYRDFWDHKPPGVFYLNALAFAIFGTDAWAVWYLNVLWALALGGGTYLLLSRMTSFRYALTGTVILLCLSLHPRFNEGLNLTEFYALLPAVLALLALERHHSRPSAFSRLLLGTSLAAAFLLKHTAIGTPLACILVAAWLEVRVRGPVRAARSLAVMSLPPVVVILALVLYWHLHDALVDLYDATVRFNLLYAQGGLTAKSVYATTRKIAGDSRTGPLFLVSVGGMVAALASTYPSSRSDPGVPRPAPKRGVHPVFAAAFLALGLEVLAISATGRDFMHYYLSVIPALCTSVAYFFPAKSRSPVTPTAHTTTPPINPVALAGILIWGLLAVTLDYIRPPASSVDLFIERAIQRYPLRTNVGKLLSSLADEKTTLLYWGIGAELNFETRLPSPSRYLYYIPLFVEGFDSSQRWGELIADLQAHPNAILISQWESGFAPMFYIPEAELQDECKCSGEVLEGFTAFSRYVRENYNMDLIFGDSYALYTPK